MKSWLGRSASNLEFPNTSITYTDETGKSVKRNSVPLEKVVESGFAALYEAYLFDEQNQADQVILTHPNSFTKMHQHRLKEIAISALSGRFNIPTSKRFKLISESDAVAFYYCYDKYVRRQASRQVQSKGEKILIYDFGAGTLDITVIDMNWNKVDLGLPEGWIIKSRLGIPVAGNYIDEILARLIDKHLRSESLQKRFNYDYKYEIVSDSQKHKLEDKKYRGNIVELWKKIRKAKHSWDGIGPFLVIVGETARQNLVIKLKDTVSNLQVFEPEETG